MYKSKYLNRIRKTVVIVESESLESDDKKVTTDHRPQFLGAQFGNAFVNQQLSGFNQQLSGFNQQAAFNQQTAAQNRPNGLASILGRIWG